MGREFKVLYCNLCSFNKGIRFEHKPEMSLPNILNIPTTKTKAAGMSVFIVLHLFFLVAVESFPLWIQLDHLCQRTSLGLRKTLLKSFFFFLFFCIWNAVDYIKCQIFSKHFSRDSTPINSSHIHFLTFHALSAVLSTDLLVLPHESG